MFRSYYHTCRFLEGRYNDALSDNITLLIVAHRLSTLKNCSQIIELDENGIKQIGSYNEVINESKDLSNNVK